MAPAGWVGEDRLGEQLLSRAFRGDFHQIKEPEEPLLDQDVELVCPEGMKYRKRKTGVGAKWPGTVSLKQNCEES